MHLQEALDSCSGISSFSSLLSKQDVESLAEMYEDSLVNSQKADIDIDPQIHKMVESALAQLAYWLPSDKLDIWMSYFLTKPDSYEPIKREFVYEYRLRNMWKRRSSVGLPPARSETPR